MHMDEAFEGFVETPDLTEKGIHSLGYVFRKGDPMKLSFLCFPETEGFKSLSSITLFSPFVQDDSINEQDRTGMSHEVPCKRISFSAPVQRAEGLLRELGLSETLKFDLRQKLNAEYELTGPDITA